MNHLFKSSAFKWGLLVTALALLAVLLSAAPSSAQGTIHKVYITNVNDQSFVVSWTTDLPVTSSVNYGPTTSLGSSKADSLVTPTTMHYVEITGLAAGATYYFETVSGTTVDNHGGAYYSVTTGPDFLFTSGDTLYGRVLSSGTPQNNVIVYLQAAQCNTGGVSQLVSSRTASDYWFYTVGNFRTANLQSQCNPVAGQIITVTAQGGSLGTGQIAPAVTAGTQQLADIILNGNPNAITLRSLTSRTDASTWLPIGLALLGTAAIVVVVARKRRD